MRHLIPCLFALLMTTPALAQVSGTVQQPIINGDPIDTDDFPSALQLIIGGNLNGQDVKAPVCTGTLVAPDVVLTAGHCLEEFSLTFGIFPLEGLTFWISFEEDLGYMLDQEHQGNPPLPDDAIEAAGFVQHPDWDFEALNAGVDGPGQFNDIALVFLDEPITDRQHAWLPSVEEDESLAEQQTVDIVGYGQLTAESGGPFDPPEPGTVYIRTHAETFINELGEFEMQIGDGEETGRKCHGDSGGPTYAQVETDLIEDVRVVGVTSHAYDERDCLVGGVDTRVGPYLDWIAEAFADACDDGVRTDCDEPGILRPADPDDGDDGGTGCRGGCAVQPRDSGGASLLLLVGALVLRRRRA